MLLELRAAEERGDPMPPVQSESGAAALARSSGVAGISFRDGDRDARVAGRGG